MVDYYEISGQRARDEKREALQKEAVVALTRLKKLTAKWEAEQNRLFSKLEQYITFTS